MPLGSGSIGGSLGLALQPFFVAQEPQAWICEWTHHNYLRMLVSEITIARMATGADCQWKLTSCKSS
jgi:hypothetical protein